MVTITISFNMWEVKLEGVSRTERPWRIYLKQRRYGVDKLRNTEKDISNMSSIKNNIFALKTGWGLSKARIVHEFILASLGYFEWIFFSAVFMRYIINAIENKKSFEYIFQFILITCVIFAFIALYRSYTSNVIFPLNDTVIYQGLYEKLYKKARNVELSCFENPEFYNKYTMAIDGAGEKITSVIKNVWGVITGVVATIIAFYSMYSIDKVAVLFVKVINCFMY